LSQQNVELIAELHRRQGVMYAGGPVEPVIELLHPDIVWHVPGTSPIAGDHRGVPAVIDYFSRRRELASETLRLHPREMLADEEVLVWLVDGSARLAGSEVHWRTVGVYRIHAARVSEVWLLALDLELFDRLWSPAG
jgi:hypothetical protein